MTFIKDYAVYRFPFGWLQVEYIGGTVISLDKLDEERSGGHKTALTDHVFSQITEYLQGKSRPFDFPFQMDGMPFQKRSGMHCRTFHMEKQGLFQPTEEQLAMFIEMFVGQLPEYIRNSLAKAGLAA